jgi:plasmid stabilization system protein ParE
LTDGFIERVISHCESFGVLPHRGTRRDSILSGLRTPTWRRTITIAFAVRDEARQVVILGVFYRGRDYLTVLAKRVRDE